VNIVVVFMNFVQRY